MVNTVIFGKVNDIRYKVEKDSYDRPQVARKVELNHNEEILRFEGEPHYNSSFSPWSCYLTTNKLNISEEEEVTEEKKVFRADLNEIHIFTDKVITETSNEKEKARVEEEVELAAASFNKEKIENNEDLKRYCDLHKLNYVDTDAVELADLVYGKNKWYMADGIIKKREKEVYITTNYEPVLTFDNNGILAYKFKEKGE